MSDKLTGGNLSFDTYIAKQESLLVDFIRRQLQDSTKVTILESALQEMYKKNEELSEQIETYKSTVDQSVNGLQAITIERNNLKARTEQLERELNDCRNQGNDLRSQTNTQNNRVVILEDEIRQLNNKIQVANNDYATLKENYNRVLAAFEEANSRLEEAAKTQEAVVPTKEKKRSKKTQDQGSEWIDGEYKIST